MHIFTCEKFCIYTPHESDFFYPDHEVTTFSNAWLINRKQSQLYFHMQIEYSVVYSILFIYSLHSAYLLFLNYHCITVYTSLSSHIHFECPNQVLFLLMVHLLHYIFVSSGVQVNIYKNLKNWVEFFSWY